MQKNGFPIRGALLPAMLAGMLTGCVAYHDEPRHVHRYAPPPVYVEPAVVVQDDYVYYPGYQVYYGSHHRHYVYLEGRTWVTAPTPPRVSLEVLFASPSVSLGFHDAPAHHHAAVVRQYPKRWAPPHGRDGKDEGNGRGGRR